ncbi:hypothetical protein ACQ4PT_051021 [Festuca glaucescens]
MTSKSGSGVAEDGSYEYKEEFVKNARGMKLFTCRWLPAKGQTVKGQVFICHGYAVECSITMRETGTRLAQAGYAVYGVDYEGHGKSEGLQGYIPSFNVLVADCDTVFAAVVASTANTELPRFLLGESMGGAVALLLHRTRPDYWTGAVLVAPMCKIAEEMMPHPVVVSVLKLMTNIIPTWKIVPTADVIDAANKMQERRDEIRNNPYCYKGKPRLQTAYELLRVSLDIENNVLKKVSLPFLIVHGGDDKVTDPSVSDLLYRSAVSQDKKLNLYPGMWHTLTSGETPENIHTVFQDIISWLDQRSSTGSSVAVAVDMSSEMEQKAKHDEQHFEKI